MSIHSLENSFTKQHDGLGLREDLGLMGIREDIEIHPFNCEENHVFHVMVTVTVTVMQRSVRTVNCECMSVRVKNKMDYTSCKVGMSVVIMTRGSFCAGW